MSISSSKLKSLKREAKLLAKALGIPLNQAQSQLAQNLGFKNWSLLAKASGRQTPQPNDLISWFRDHHTLASVVFPRRYRETLDMRAMYLDDAAIEPLLRQTFPTVAQADLSVAVDALRTVGPWACPDYLRRFEKIWDKAQRDMAEREEFLQREADADAHRALTPNEFDPADRRGLPQHSVYSYFCGPLDENGCPAPAQTPGSEKKRQAGRIKLREIALWGIKHCPKDVQVYDVMLAFARREMAASTSLKNALKEAAETAKRRVYRDHDRFYPMMDDGLLGPDD